MPTRTTMGELSLTAAVRAVKALPSPGRWVMVATPTRPLGRAYPAAAAV